MSAQNEQRPAHQASGWAVGGLAFAGFLLGLIGLFQVIAGLTAIFDDKFFVVTANYTFDIDTTAWGWVHLVVGIAMLATTAGLASRARWAAIAATVLALISAVANFFFVPYYPLWSLLIIALDVWIIWSLTRPGVAHD